MNIILYLNLKKEHREDALAMAEYCKRLQGDCRVLVYCRPAEDRSAFPEVRPDEPHARAFQLRPGPSSDSSPDMARRLNQYAVQGVSTLYFFIGYPLLADIPIRSLSTMDISTGLTGVLLCEQLYRCFRILKNQPYHK